MPLHRDFREMLCALFEEDAEFLLVGAMAVAAHGYARATGVDFEEAWPRRFKNSIDDMEVPVISREDLIRNKKAVARPQDLADVARLEGKAGTRTPKPRRKPPRRRP